MATNHSFTGVVETSRTEKRGCGGLITKLIVTPDAELEAYVEDPFERPEIHIPGRHNIRTRDRVRINYSIHSGAYWANNYDVLDESGKVLHSDIAEG